MNTLPSTGRMPLYDTVAERGVLAACLLSANAFDEAAARLQKADWYHGKHLTIWEAMVALRGRGDPVDVVTVHSYMAGRKELDAQGGAELAAMSELMVSADHVGTYCTRITETARKRDMAAAGSKIVSLGYDATKPLAEVVAEAESALATAAGRPVFTRATGADMAAELLQAIAKAQRGEIPQGHRTGFRELDELTLGLQPGEFSAIGARSSMGKTTFALALVAQLLDDGRKVGIVSLEMPRLQLARNLAAARAGVDGQRVRSGQLSAEENARVLDVAEWLSRVNLVVDDAPPGPGGLVTSRVRSLVARDRCDVVVLDYLQLIQIEDHRAAESELGAVSRGLKLITREHPHAHVVAVCQLNRDVEKRRDHEPMLSDLRGSGQLEQDLDLVLMLLRPSYYDRGADPRLTQVHVVKARNGPTGMVQLSFRRELLRFEEPPLEGFDDPKPKKKRGRFGKGRKNAPGDAQE